MPLVVKLRPQEKIIINGVVLGRNHNVSMMASLSLFSPGNFKSDQLEAHIKASFDNPYHFVVNIRTKFDLNGAIVYLRSFRDLRFLNPAQLTSFGENRLAWPSTPAGRLCDIILKLNSRSSKSQKELLTKELLHTYRTVEAEGAPRAILKQISGGIIADRLDQALCAAQGLLPQRVKREILSEAPA